MDRYQKLFSMSKSKGEGVFIPFVVLGDPDPATSLKIIEGLVENGADALELGFPFSDPIADGPVIQRAGQRALGAGVRQEDCFRIIKEIRKKFAGIPIGLLVYANLVLARGLGAFFLAAKKAGADSVLIADVPLLESAPFRRAAEQAGIDLVLVLPLHADRETVAKVAGKSRGYLYLLSRKGVTGVDQEAGLPSRDLMQDLKNLNAAPPVLGFGVSIPEQVSAALEAGCRGVISGSAVVQRVEDYVTGKARLEDLFAFIRKMKDATR